MFGGKSRNFCIICAKRLDKVVIFIDKYVFSELKNDNFIDKSVALTDFDKSDLRIL